MQRFPEIVTPAGITSLPASGASACRLAAALVAGQDGRADVALLACALARDPALALWAVIQAGQSGAGELRTLDAIANWLSPLAIDLFSLAASPSPAVTQPAAPDRAESDCGPWTDLASRSVGVAGLAAGLARLHGLDDKAVYMLGLLHLARDWLAAAPQSPASDVLPQWLHDALAQVSTDTQAGFSTPADCVRAAIAWSENAGPDEPLPAGLELDRAAWQQQVAAARDDWRIAAPPELLPRLAARLRRLRDLEANFAQRLEAEKLESLKELAYGAGHEINNPLANISARAQALLADERDPDRRRMLASINAQAFRGHEMIADMMLFARPPQPEMQPVDLVPLLVSLRDELAEQAAAQHTELSLEVPSAPLVITADATQIAVAVRSLCVNALEALVAGGQVRIALAADPTAEQVQVTVTDDGPGIPPEVRPKIFDPYFSGREAGRGLGLGLSKCWRIVTLHGGRIDVECPPERGAVFRVSLPAGNAR